jgi:O-6-methylguanine DNA methyltransferase
MPHWTAIELEPGFAFFLQSDGEKLTGAAFSTSAAESPPGWDEAGRTDDDPILRQAAREIREYFAGRRRVFTVPFEAEGTHFQCEVWKALCEIPYGEVRTYAGIAKVAGNPKAARAVGGANHANPIPIFIPCHRVVTSDGGLGGFAVRLEFKRKLLAIEGVRR